MSSLLALALLLALTGSDNAELAAEENKQTPAADKPKQTKPPDRAEIERLVRRLGSDSFADREEAMKELRRLGKPALEALRNAAAASDDKEVRRRAAALVTQLLEPPYEKQFKEGMLLLDKTDYRQAVTALKQAAEMYENDPTIPRATQGRSDQPILAEIYLHLARAHRGLEEYEKASNAYHGALYNYNYNNEKREQIERECRTMIDALLAKWKKGVKAKIAKDAALKALAGRYPLVVLHTRRFAGGRYFKSAYSFIYETTDESKHFNDVQLLFDNGGEGNRLDVNMLGGQQNLVVDLGDVDFVKDPDPKKVDPDSDDFWMPDGCKVVEGHVYLERVRDDRGNKFYVVLKVIAADKDSRYMAFIWRRLPGGKVVKRP
jgi:tetratricopeptide (TPR) repeat protein